MQGKAFILCISLATFYVSFAPIDQYSGSGEKCVGTVPNTWHSAIKQPPEIFFIKRYSMKFRKIHKKTPAPESLFLKFQAKACNFIKKETLAQVFPVNFAKFLRKLFYIENL